MVEEATAGSSTRCARSRWQFVSGKGTDGGCTLVQPPSVFGRVGEPGRLESSYSLAQAVGAERLDVIAAIER